ncbi:FAD/NAD(P)-binding domain-containing protein [Wilcoxina mikolae CBS 423.85]|nr:FAD/NAD(P)-binding domain-containing protein [Wilcoxina mikolae CBS 423.85]
MDDFTLPSSSWDVLVFGTGVKPSLLAVSLSRAGKKVLQLDPNTYYGSNEAAFSLDELETWATTLPSDSPFSHASVERRIEIARPRGYTLSLAPHLVYWGSNLLKLLREVDMTTAFTWQAVGSWWVYLTDAAVTERAESGGLGGVLVDAGVKAVKAGGTIRKKGGWNKGRKKSRDVGSEVVVGEGSLSELKKSTEFSSLRRLGELREVPCTFEDVAWSPDLQDRDRGYLGGFLRFVMKCGDPEDTKHHQLLQDHAETSLTDFLTTVYPLPLFTIASLHSLTLLPTPPHKTPLRAAIAALTAHVNSIGRIPDIRSSAALTIAYGGSAELCQVWSRGAAVAGGLNVLSRGITSIQEVEDKLSVSLSNGETVTADWVITSPTPSSATTTTSLAKGIFIVTAPLDSLFSRKSEADRIVPNAVVLTFPVGSLEVEGAKNESPVYIIAHSSGTGECGKDEAVLYTSTLQPQPLGYTFSDIAVKRVLEACGEEDAEVAFVCRYTQSFSAEEAQGEERVVALKQIGRELAFNEDVVEECKAVYERIVGTREGFLEMGEEMKRQYVENEE